MQATPAALLSGRRLAGAAAMAVTTVWGGILVIAPIERRLPDAQQWYGHAAVHLWTMAGALVIARAGATWLRDDRVEDRPLRVLLGTTTVLAVVAAIAGLLDAVGAYPTLRVFHDVVNAVAAPTGWLLLGSLVAIVVAGLTEPLRATSARPGA
jgi:hypothetical protein